ncbi:MAG: glycosyltransferase [Elusimicrobia bacterium]|nr:glycosyltransferase [Elusimicrobiota bacterium]
MSDPLELTVLLPTLDEGAHLAKVLADVNAAASRLTGSFEVLVVDGGSRDDTVAAACAAGARVLRQRGRGYGQALREGLDAARGGWILSMDADGSHPVRYFGELWARREGCDLVIASRFVPGGGGRMPWHRFALSWLLNSVTRRVLDWPIRDSSSGLRLYRREAAAGLPLAAEDFSVQQEALALILAKGGRVAELPFFYEPRLSGESKADVPLLARRYLGMLARLRRARGGWTGPAALAGALALGLAVGLWGIGWGLPGPQRWRAFPEAMRSDPDTARKLKESWQSLYQGIERTHQEVKGEEPVTRVQGVEEVPPGWTWPPDKLVNSYRSLLVRSENPDEQKAYTVLARMRPWRLELEPLYLQYGGSFVYPLGAFLEAAALLRAARVVPDLGHYLLHPEDMGRLFLLGRLFVLLFQVASLWVLFDLGRRLSGPWTGFCAAALFCLSPLVASQTHIVKPHPYAAFWALAAMRYWFRVYEDGRRPDALWGGLCLGMAAGANSSLLLLSVLPLLVRFMRRGSPGAGRRELWDVFLSLSAAGGVYAATNPYILLATKDFLWETTVYPAHVRDFGGNLASLLGPWAVGGLGSVLYAAAAMALLIALVRPEPRRRILALMFVVGFGVLWLFIARFWGFAGPGMVRFFYPFWGLACLLAADLICAAKIPGWIRVLLLAAAFADSGLRSWVYLQNFHLDAGPYSTRLQAADWIDAHIPAGASIGLTRYPQPAHTPPFRYDRYRLVIFERPEFLKLGQRPEYLVTDAGNRPELAPLTEYRMIQAFESYRLAWVGVDDTNFANISFFIYGRRQ